MVEPNTIVQENLMTNFQFSIIVFQGWLIKLQSLTNVSFTFMLNSSQITQEIDGVMKKIWMPLLYLVCLWIGDHPDSSDRDPEKPSWPLGIHWKADIRNKELTKNWETNPRLDIGCS